MGTIKKRDSQYKLIYYPAGNIRQLFDISNDPDEMTDLSQSDSHKKILNQLTNELIKRLYGSDIDWINQGKLEGIKINGGLQDGGYENEPTGTKRGLGGQRGLRLK